MREKIITNELKNELSKFSKYQNHQKILQFYLFESPVEGDSYRGRVFKQKNWVGSKLKILKREMLRIATPELEKNYQPCSKEELEIMIDKYPVAQEEYCVFLNNKGAVTSLYKAIRNALAHGSFDVRNYKGTTVYFFANFDKYYKAKIVLRQKTLLEWIQIFNNGPEFYSKKGIKK